MNNANAARAANIAGAHRHAELAARSLDDQQLATEFLDRLHAARVQPDELAAIVAYGHFLLLNAACEVVRKVLAVRHG